MSKKFMEDNHGCQVESHDEHLCYIISQGFHLADEQGYKALVDKPKFKCEHCGRAAKSKKNLCEPVEL